jgi:Peptidase family M48
MQAAFVYLAAIAIGCVLTARALASACWPRRSLVVAIALWQAIGLSWGLATVAALVVYGVSGLHRQAVAGFAIGVRALSLAAGVLLFAVLCWILAAAVAAVLRARHRQRTLLDLLAHDDPKVPGALVVDHPAATAYCVPGLRSAIVISAGTLDLLDQAELAAVLAHERAHLRARHDLVLLPFTALLRAFRWSATARAANQEVALLVEMLADDRARRLRPARELATALLRVGAAGGGYAPAGALAATGAAGQAPLMSPAGRIRPGAAHSESELAARVTRLLRPPPGLPVGWQVVLVAVAALIVVAPAAALFMTL